METVLLYSFVFVSLTAGVGRDHTRHTVSCTCGVANNKRARLKLLALLRCGSLRYRSSQQLHVNCPNAAQLLSPQCDRCVITLCGIYQPSVYCVGSRVLATAGVDLASLDANQQPQSPLVLEISDVLWHCVSEQW